jgi:hypothetical protein
MKIYHRRKPPIGFIIKSGGEKPYPQLPVVWGIAFALKEANGFRNKLNYRSAKLTDSQAGLSKGHQIKTVPQISAKATSLDESRTQAQPKNMLCERANPEKIANKYDITVASIKEANNLKQTEFPGNR